jgi:hypothetical protein
VDEKCEDKMMTNLLINDVNINVMMFVEKSSEKKTRNLKRKEKILVGST